jgi:hypothetical protein
MKHGGEDRIAILQFHREIVAHGILSFHCTATLDDSGFKKHTLGKGGLALPALPSKAMFLISLVCILSYQKIKVLVIKYVC